MSISNKKIRCIESEYEPMNSQKPTFTFKKEDFKHHSDDKVRYGDTDRQGHVNNAMFVRYFETSRTEILYDPKMPLHEELTSFVIASMNVEFLNEIHWPGHVDLYTNVLRLGNSSITFEQAIYQEETLCSYSTCVIVHVSNETKKSAALPTKAIQYLETIKK
jgi:acyl-CoA thioester hydrolase